MNETAECSSNATAAQPSHLPPSRPGMAACSAGTRPSTRLRRDSDVICWALLLTVTCRTERRRAQACSEAAASMALQVSVWNKQPPWGHVPRDQHPPIANPSEGAYMGTHVNPRPLEVAPESKGCSSLYQGMHVARRNLQ